MDNLDFLEKQIDEILKAKRDRDLIRYALMEVMSASYREGRSDEAKAVAYMKRISETH